jgi:predicted TIM-barrel fold metal-dependent hydrolase
MSDDFLPPPERPSRPKHAVPTGATDCHAHIFGPFDRFPLADVRSYTPPELTGERYLSTLDGIGFSHGVLVQPTCHGTDCRALVNAVHSSNARLRGIAVITSNISDEELGQMDRAGIRGARFIRPPSSVYKNWVGFDTLELLAPRLIRLGWHAQIWAHCADLVDSLPSLLNLNIPLVVDHMSYFDASRGVDDESFQVMLRLLGAGRIWLKLGSFRLSKRYPDYEDVVPFHKALLAANPERLIWGSDWPHVHMTADMPDVGHVVDLLNRWTDDASLLRRILVDNPAALYGF